MGKSALRGLVAVIALAAGCHSTGVSDISPCAPGEVQSCTGVDACSGQAVCGANGEFGACSCGSVDGGPDGASGSGGAGGTSASGGTSGGGMSGMSGAGGTKGSGGAAGAGGTSNSGGAAGAVGAAGSGGSDAGLDASLGGAGGADASSGGAGGTDAGTDAGGTAGADSGGACPGGVTGGDGTVSYPLWPVPNADLRATGEFTTTNDTVLDHATCLMWQRSVNAGTYSWDAAKAVCEGLGLAGYNDWRLPTRAELATITDYTAYPAINQSVFANTPMGANVNTFWASTVLASDANSHWVVLLGGAGQVAYQPSTNSYSVRCVRGSGAPTTARFDSSTPAVVFDLETGLEWEASPPNQEYSQTEADTYCQNLVLDNKSDWRLPSIRELTTLIDPADATRALPASFALVGAWYWSSSQTAGYGYWGVSMGIGYTAIVPTNAGNHRVRCVR